MRILIITPSYYPGITPRVHRWTSIAEVWARQGHEVSVVCASRPTLLKTETRRGVKINRVGHDSLESMLDRKPKKAGTEIGAEDFLGSPWLFKSSVWLYRKIWGNIYFPDYACVWYLPAKRKVLAMLKAEKFDAIISSSLPFTSHLLGLACKKAYPSIPWLADMGDPFALQEKVSLNNRFLYHQWNVQLEEKVLNKADLVTVTTPAVIDLFERQFEKEWDNIVVIPPLKSQWTKESLDLELSKEKIHLGYFGRFYKELREPMMILKVLKAIFKYDPKWKEQIVVHFFGHIKNPFSDTLETFKACENSLQFHAPVSREKVMNVMQSMDVLLNLGNQSDFQLPSKSVDYLASGRAILNLHSLENDTFKDFLKDYPLIFNLKMEEEREVEKLQIERLVAFLMESKEQYVPQEEIKRRSEPYQATQIAAKYLSQLQELENRVGE